MRRDIDDVEIKEPPIREFEKKNSCLKRTCMIGCGSTALFVAATVFIVLHAGRPRPIEHHDVPKYVVATVPLYDADHVSRVSVLKGSDRGRLIERLALLPKVLLSPLALSLDEDADLPLLERLRAFLDRPVTDHRNVVELEWTDLSAEPKFIQEYYEKALIKEGYAVVIASETNTLRQFTFSKNNTTGVAMIHDRADTDGTDSVRITVHIPHYGD